MVVRLAANQDTGDVAAGRAFIGDQSRVVLDRGDPYHLLHRGLAARARQDAFSCFPTRTRRIPSLERRTSFLVASACTLYDPNFCAMELEHNQGPPRRQGRHHPSHRRSSRARASFHGWLPSWSSTRPLPCGLGSRLRIGFPHIDGQPTLHIGVGVGLTVLKCFRLG
jgi:hypothetical protein